MCCSCYGRRLTNFIPCSEILVIVELSPWRSPLRGLYKALPRKRELHTWSLAFAEIPLAKKVALVEVLPTHILQVVRARNTRAFVQKSLKTRSLGGYLMVTFKTMPALSQCFYACILHGTSHSLLPVRRLQGCNFGIAWCMCLDQV